MSQPQQKSPAPVAARPGAGAWKSRIAKARRTWSKLPGAELAKVNGDMARLGDLLRRHYAYSDAEIDRQIAGFLVG